MNFWLNLFFYQASFYACILGAKYQHPWIGLLLTLLFFIVQLYLVRDRKKHVVVVVAIFAMGIVIESISTLCGVMNFSAVSGWFYIFPREHRRSTHLESGRNKRRS